MDAGGDNCSNETAMVTLPSHSSDSEIEILPGSTSKFSNVKASQSNSLNSINQPSISKPTHCKKHKSFPSANIKTKVTIINDDDKKKKNIPKNIVHMSESSDSSSTDDESILNTSISLNMFGSIPNANRSSSHPCSATSFKEITQVEGSSVVPVEQQHSSKKGPYEDALINGWTKEMYTFYNEINNEDGNVQKLFVFRTGFSRFICFYFPRS